MADTRAMFKPNLLLIRTLRYFILNLRQHGCYSGNFKLILNLNIYYLYNEAIFKYGGHARYV